MTETQTDTATQLLEAAARAVALCANEGHDWPVRDEDRHDARAVLAAVLTLLADDIKRHAGEPTPIGVYAGVSAWPLDRAAGYGAAVDEIDALLRDLAEQVSR